MATTSAVLCCMAVTIRWDARGSLLTAGSGRFPVRGYAPLLSRIMDDQGERAPERRTSDIEFHWNIRLHRHGSSGPSPVGASRSLQTLLSRPHVPAFGTRVCMHPRIVAGPHDSVRENGSEALCGGKLQWSDDGDSFTSSVADEEHFPVPLSWLVDLTRPGTDVAVDDSRRARSGAVEQSVDLELQ